mmetsp:Transcript_29533/g.48733  ORF Transcript_29533/g.48733 Transcript_29533/m.48733 type:complete len:239 (+) Transcript_29533:26-742(+)
MVKFLPVHSLSLIALFLLCNQARASSYHVPLASPLIPSRSQRKRNGRSYKMQSVLLASAKTKVRKAPAKSDRRPLINPAVTEEVADIPKFQDLPFQWKLVFGGIEIAYTVGTQWLSGFATAYLLGSVTGAVGFSKPPTDGITRFARWNQRNVKWGKSWGSVSASFSGFDTSVRLLRNNKVDEWNSLFGSACAGAFFARSQGPGSMAKSAILYASFGYFFMRAGQKNSNQMLEVEEMQL